MSSTEALPVIDDAWVVEQRGARNAVQAGRAYGLSVERERQRDGAIDDVLTVLTVNRECPLRCVMCDLWKNTLEDRSPAGSVADQVDAALAAHADVSRIKIYNAGSFFDRGSIPQGDVDRIMDATRHLRTIVIESHPSMIGKRAVEFAEAVGPDRVEVAMGLETVHPDVLPRLNKRMTLDDFEQATARLLRIGCSVRAFVLVRPPFLSEEEGFEWAIRSVSWARSVGVECSVLIPVRGGNGAMEALSRHGVFEPPRLATLERALDACMDAAQGRVFADLWDAAQFGSGDHHAAARIRRMEAMNLSQVRAAPIACGDSAP